MSTTLAQYGLAQPGGPYVAGGPTLAASTPTPTPTPSPTGPAVQTEDGGYVREEDGGAALVEGTPAMPSGVTTIDIALEGGGALDAESATPLATERSGSPWIVRDFQGAEVRRVPAASSAGTTPVLGTEDGGALLAEDGTLIDAEGNGLPWAGTFQGAEVLA